MKRSIPLATIRENVPVMALAGIAFGASYGHIVELCGRHGPHGWVQFATAGCVDLLCVIGAEERQRDKRFGRPRVGKWVSWPTLVLIIGIALTLAANIATAKPDLLGWFVAALPAGALLLAVSVLERRASFEAPASTKANRRRYRTAGTDPVASPVPAEAAAPEPVPAKVPAGEGPQQPWTDEDLVAEARRQWAEHAEMGVRLSQSRFELALKKSPRGGAGRPRVIEALRIVRAEMDGADDEAAAVAQ